jgi:protoporphyrinogen oxidase
MSRPVGVLVIGGGPAGIAAAAALREGGCEVTVLEREGAVGGKCRSLHLDGRTYDLGANLTTPRYTTIRPLAQELGLTPRTIPERRLVDIDLDQMVSVSDRTLLERMVLLGGSSLYGLARSGTRVDLDGLQDARPGAAQPFGDWLRRIGLGPLQPLFSVLFTAYGYGNMAELPAAYALKFFDPIHLNAAIKVVLGSKVTTTTDFVEGFQELWVRLVKRARIDARCNVEIRSIVRSPQGVHARWTEAGLAREGRFDRLVVATPYTVLDGFLDLSPEEARLISKIQTNDYYVTAAVVRDAPARGTYIHPYARTLTPGQPTVYYAPVPDDDNDVHLFYAYGGTDVTVEGVRANIMAALSDEALLEGTVERFLATQHWRYFPHVSSSVMQGGFYRDFDALQGAWNTWWVGETLSFPLVELVVRHARSVVDRML